ncbi:MAG TPA: M15 family metallopeptidase [Thermoanaerobaculia bacterium]|nr:M15 family metallopeptidase [Thermoanaerobaculia bacterium]
MLRRINLALVLFLAFACASTDAIRPNRYGLRVVPDAATYERIAAADPSQRLVDLSTLPGVRLDIRYATEDNFMKRQLYPVAKAYLRAPAAEALRAVQEDLQREGLALKVWDAYRPYRVTEAMWEPIRNPDYVADPARGSRHNRGAAVDVTLVDRNGYELMMPTGYDDFSPRAAIDSPEVSRQTLLNRTKLREVMERHGFEPLPSEWWHYDFRGWERFDLMDVPLEDLARQVP